ncbi:D-aminoacylase [Collimonas sp.]|jgi:N-acyl-D-amino-acid deacylase|uniref:N-acyl-D-amino-acid deacylase family protein n=1 Tax=Collimonas sp. TaxID=1963772 RepID=UPI002C19BD22|nr:D-aminoacylase [Collimonas sp.]HWW99473.1 D-aminoacylase [Collimonas sp.]
MNTLTPSHADHHLLIRGGSIVDGTGKPRYQADIRIVGDRIAEIGMDLPVSGAAVHQAHGQIVSPGFIDAHTHDDQALLSTPEMLPKISQGVTTVIIGNCGISLAPLVHANAPSPLSLLGGTDKHIYPTMRSYVEAVRAAGPAINAAALVGHSTLRVSAMADPYGATSDAELAAMCALLEEAMAAGAAGFSSGLYYPTNSAATIDEVVALATIASKAGGIYATHMRSEFEDILEAMDEAFATGRRADIPVILSHHKCAGHANWGRTVQTLAKIDDARREQRVALDAYPYIAGSTVLDSNYVDDITDIMVTWSSSHPEMTGRYLGAIAAEWRCTQKEACDQLQPGGGCYFQMCEEDVQRVLSYPHTMIGSDGLPHDQHPHPRLWGTFPRVLGHYSRDLGLFSLEEAVRRMTGLPAAEFRLRDRGLLAPGKFADLVVFDPARIKDRATFEAPLQTADGIDLVIVNGQVSYESKTGVTARRSGRFLSRHGADVHK